VLFPVKPGPLVLRGKRSPSSLVLPEPEVPEQRVDGPSFFSFPQPFHTVPLNSPSRKPNSRSVTFFPQIVKKRFRAPDLTEMAIRAELFPLSMMICPQKKTGFPKSISRPFPVTHINTIPFLGDSFPPIRVPSQEETQQSPLSRQPRRCRHLRCFPLLVN